MDALEKLDFFKDSYKDYDVYSRGENEVIVVNRVSKDVNFETCEPTDFNVILALAEIIKEKGENNMFTIEEKVNLLKKYQKKYLEGGLSRRIRNEVDEHNLMRSFIGIGYREPETITAQDILAEEL